MRVENLHFGFVFKKYMFRSLGSSYWTSAGGARGKVNESFPFSVFHATLVCNLCTSHSDCIGVSILCDQARFVKHLL
jgi:hypothetical protein